MKWCFRPGSDCSSLKILIDLHVANTVLHRETSQKFFSLMQNMHTLQEFTIMKHHALQVIINIIMPEGAMQYVTWSHGEVDGDRLAEVMFAVKKNYTIYSPVRPEGETLAAMARMSLSLAAVVPLRKFWHNHPDFNWNLLNLSGRPDESVNLWICEALTLHHFTFRGINTCLQCSHLDLIALSSFFFFSRLTPSSRLRYTSFMCLIFGRHCSQDWLWPFSTNCFIITSLMALLWYELARFACIQTESGQMVSSWLHPRVSWISIAC